MAEAKKTKPLHGWRQLRPQRPPCCPHTGKHIPGNPTVVPQNMAGAGSLRLANLLYNVAPKDGTTFGMVGRGVSMEPMLGTEASKFHSRRYTWIGSVSNHPSVCVSWRTSKLKSWNDRTRPR